MRLTHDAKEWIGLVATIVVVMGVLALVTEDEGVQWNFLSSILLTIVIYAIFALALSLEFGYTGLLNFGHVGFMLIGAYAYGILMMPEVGRPVDAPAPVGALFDAAPALAGATAWGAIAVTVAAFVAGAIVAFPILLALRALRPSVRTGRSSLYVGLGVGLAVAVGVFVALFPLTSAGAMNTAAFLAVLAGMALAALAGLLLGLPTVRLREDYLAIVTIGAAEILRSVVLNEEAWTRGSRTIVNLHRPVSDWALGSDWWRDFARSLELKPASFALLVISVVGLVYIFTLLETLVRSPWGRVLKAIREDEEAAAALGKNVLLHKLQSLMVGGAIAALAGVVLITAQGLVTPVAFLPIITFYAFIIVVMGGMGSHKGAIAGAFLLWGIFSLAQNLGEIGGFSIAAGPPQVIFVGVLLILIMMFRPQGLVGRKEELVYAK